jgi:hypothetical protein
VVAFVGFHEARHAAQIRSTTADCSAERCVPRILRDRNRSGYDDAGIGCIARAVSALCGENEPLNTFAPPVCSSSLRGA